jgi:hypothetical protein
MTAQKDNLVPLPPESGKAGTALLWNCFHFASVLGIRKKTQYCYRMFVWYSGWAAAPIHRWVPMWAPNTGTEAGASSGTSSAIRAGYCTPRALARVSHAKEGRIDGVGTPVRPSCLLCHWWQHEPSRRHGLFCSPPTCPRKRTTRRPVLHWCSNTTSRGAMPGRCPRLGLCGPDNTLETSTPLSTGPWLKRPASGG